MLTTILLSCYSCSQKESKPNASKEHFYKGNDYLFDDNIPDAIKEYELALKADSNNWQACYQMAQIYQLQGDISNAFMYFNKTLTINPRFALGYYGRSSLAELIGDDQRCAKDLNKAVALKKDLFVGLPASAKPRMSFLYDPVPDQPKQFKIRSESFSDVWQQAGVPGGGAYGTARGMVALPVLSIGYLMLALLVAWLVLVACSATAGLGPFRLSRTGVIAIPFTLAAFPLIFSLQTEILGAFDLGPLHLTVSAEGLRRFGTIAAGSWLSVQVALLLAFTTPFHDLVDALRELRLPRILVSIVSFMYRYLAVLTDEASRMLRARDARSAAPDSSAAGGRSARGAHDRGRRIGGSLRWRATATRAIP